jgi:hypothetical protein
LRWIKRDGRERAYLLAAKLAQRAEIHSYSPALELTPGPNMAYLTTLALDRGRRAGLLATVGVAAGLSLHAIVAALGLGVLISEAPLIYDLLRWIGCLSPVPGVGDLAIQRESAGHGGRGIKLAVLSCCSRAN